MLGVKPVTYLYLASASACNVVQHNTDVGWHLPFMMKVCGEQGIVLQHVRQGEDSGLLRAGVRPAVDT